MRLSKVFRLLSTQLHQLISPFPNPNQKVFRTYRKETANGPTKLSLRFHRARYQWHCESPGKRFEVQVRRYN